MKRTTTYEIPIKPLAPVKEEGLAPEESQLDKKLEKKLRNYIKNNNPVVIKNRNEYSNQYEVIKRRKELNKHRRMCATTVMNLLRNQKLTDQRGNFYSIMHNKLIRENTDGSIKEIIKCDKKGKIESYKFKDEIDLATCDLNNIFPGQDNKEELHEVLSRLLEGDEEIENLIKKKKKIVDAELEEKDYYWKTFNDEQKKDFLEKIINPGPKQKREKII